MSGTDAEAKVAKMKEQGRRISHYKPEHAVDLEAQRMVAAEIHPASRRRRGGALPGA